MRSLAGGMSSTVALHTQLATVMESLVHAAVAELKKLVEGGSAFMLSLQVRAQAAAPGRLQDESREKMVS